MMLIRCPICGRSELGSYSALRGVRNTPTGIELVLRCRAGHEVVEATGRRRAPAPPPGLSSGSPAGSARCQLTSASVSPS